MVSERAVHSTECIKIIFDVAGTPPKGGWKWEYELQTKEKETYIPLRKVVFRKIFPNTNIEIILAVEKTVAKMPCK
jgi:hypothetical protein